MFTTIGHVEALFRYPVKSMAGESLASASLGWHGLEGDRRLAFRRVGHTGGTPWLTAGKLPALVLYAAWRSPESGADAPPTHVRTPDGELLPAFSEALAQEVGRRYGAAVEMMQISNGIFDDANLSIITSGTVNAVAAAAGQVADCRRFRPNIVVRLEQPAAFAEDAWLGGLLVIGDGDDGAAVTLTSHDVRCAMINLDPDTARPAPAMLQAVVRSNQGRAGVYAGVVRTGRIAIGQPVRISSFAPGPC